MCPAQRRNDLVVHHGDLLFARHQLEQEKLDAHVAIGHELLAYLLRHPGQVLTREQLLEHVWGYDYAGETRTVDVHVHWLRSRIETDPANPAFLHTVRGVGYVFRRPT